MKTWTVGRMAALVASAAIVALAWWFLAPAQLGGRTAYVTTSGTSMEPLLHAGDLAVVRATGDYRVGDVVAYRNSELHAVVLHRIVGIHDGRYAFEGDNNTWIDDAHPTADALLGEMVFRIPGMGGRLGAVRSPWGLSAIAGMAVVGVVGGRKRSRRGRDRHDAGANGSSNGHRPTARGEHSPRGGAGVVVALSAALALVGAIVSVIAFALPSTVGTHRDVAFTQRGTFSYSASAGPHGQAVYGRADVTTGDPMYLRLTRTIDLRFAYDLETAGVFDGGGTAALVAVLSDGSGWNRTFTLAAPGPFTGSRTTLAGTLDLDRLASLVRQVEHLTGVHRDVYQVSVRPEVSLDGRVDGIDVQRLFAPALTFELDALELQLPPAAPSSDGAVVDPLHPSATAQLTSRGSAPRAFSVFGASVPLRDVRAAGVALGVAGALGLMTGLAMRWRAARRGEAAVIATRYGQWLVPVRSSTVAGGRIVQVESFDSLRRLAEHYGHVVLHEEGDGFHAYSVEENGVTYRYRIANGVRP